MTCSNRHSRARTSTCTLTRAHDLIEQALDGLPSDKAKTIYMMYSRLLHNGVLRYRQCGSH